MLPTIPFEEVEYVLSKLGKMAELLEIAGGVDGTLKAFSPGGASSGYLPASKVDPRSTLSRVCDRTRRSSVPSRNWGWKSFTALRGTVENSRAMITSPQMRLIFC